MRVKGRGPNTGVRDYRANLTDHVTARPRDARPRLEEFPMEKGRIQKFGRNIRTQNRAKQANDLWN
jgi:hypothetical protein